MRIENIIQKKTYKVKITIEIFTNFSINNVQYQVVRFEMVEKGKRKWIDFFDKWRNEYPYRNTEYDKRSDYLKNKMLEYCTIEDIKDSIDKAYQCAAPNYDEIVFRT